MSNNGTNVLIGRKADSAPSLYFNGVIDDARIKNRALSASEIQALANPVT
jgi:hypothetical protein